MSALIVVLPAAALLLLGARRHPRWPRHRTLAGLAGLTALLVAGLLGARADEQLSVHVIEHQLISMVAAPLLVAAAPVRLALGAGGSGLRAGLARALHTAPARALAQPLVGLTLFSAVMLAAHLPAAQALTQRSAFAHAAEHVALLWAAIALWVPLVGVDPLPHRTGMAGRLATLVAAMSVMASLGAWLSALPRPAYAAYPDLADQHLAGGLMWEGGMVVLLPAILACAWGALMHEERGQQARDRHATVRGTP